MSNKHNYSQYSAKKNEKPVAPKTEERLIAPEVKMETVAKPEPTVKPEPVKPAEPILVEETVQTAPLPKTVSGIVVDCSKLNVRSEPSLFADVVCVLDVASEIKIDVAQSNNDWFKICTAAGTEGYCMRKFVKAHM